jgi:hypothetical protein
VDTDPDTLATALSVKTDDLLKSSPQLAPWRLTAGITPQLSDAELVTPAILGFTSEARWLRHAHAHLGTCSRTCPSSPATTSDCARAPNSSVMSHANWPQTRHYFGRDFQVQLADMHIDVLRPARKGEAKGAGSQLFMP